MGFFQKYPSYKKIFSKKLLIKKIFQKYRLLKGILKIRFATVATIFATDRPKSKYGITATIIFATDQPKSTTNSGGPRNFSHWIPYFILLI